MVRTSDNMRRFNSEIQAQVSTIETSIIMGRLSIDEGLRQINNLKNAAGWDAVNAERDAWYQRNRHIF